MAETSGYLKFIEIECKNICRAAGMGEEKTESLTHLTLLRYKRGELTNGLAIAKFVKGSAKKYMAAMAKIENDPIKRQ